MEIPDKAATAVKPANKALIIGPSLARIIYALKIASRGPLKQMPLAASVILPAALWAAYPGRRCIGTASSRLPRGCFTAVHESLVGPSRHFLLRSNVTIFPDSARVP